MEDKKTRRTRGKTTGSGAPNREGTPHHPSPSLPQPTPRAFTPVGPLTASGAQASRLPIPSAGLPPSWSPPPPVDVATAAAFLRRTLLDAVPPAPPADALLAVTAPADRAAAVKGAAAWAWAGYKAHAWGADELAPLSRAGYETFCSLSVTAIDALDTLWLLGLEKEARHAADWVASTLPARLSDGDACTVSVFETAIRVVGGLVAAADSPMADTRLGALAADVAARLLPAFDTPSGVPLSAIDVGRPPATTSADDAATRAAAFRGSAPGTALLAEAFLAPELWRASVYTPGASGRTAHALPRSPIAAAATRAVEAVLAGAPASGHGLLPTTLSTDTGGAEWAERHTVGGKTDSAYEYLLKMWLLVRHEDAAGAGDDSGAHAETGRTASRRSTPPPGERYRAAWERAMDAVMDRLVMKSPIGAAYLTSDLHEPVMEHLACFLPGNLATGVLTGAVKDAHRIRKYTDAAQALLATCVAMGDTPTGLALEVSLFLLDGPRPGHPFSLLRPEVAESLYLTWRLTHNATWPEAGWRLFAAIETHAKIASGGYSGVRDVSVLPVTHDDSQPSWLLAETFKYLWLLFSEAGAQLDLQREWVLTTEAHLVRVFGV